MTSPFETSPRGRLTDQEKAEIFVRRGGVCHRCKRNLRAGDGWIVEHMQALENGGTNDPDNLDITCEWCKPLKDAEDHGIAAKARHVRTKHVVPKGERDKRRGFRGWRGFDGRPIWRNSRKG